MVDKDFQEFIDYAMEQYKEYEKLDKGDFSFQEFLMIVLIWKTEEILERLETPKK